MSAPISPKEVWPAHRVPDSPYYESDGTPILCGCGSKNGSEVDGQEFECTTMSDLLQCLGMYPEIHLWAFGDDDIEIWLKKL